MKYMCFRSGKRWMSVCFLLFTALLALRVGGRTGASESVHSAPVKTASFPTQVYNFEKLLEAENDVLSFREAAREASPSYDPDFVPEGADGPVQPTPEQFLADIRDSYEARLSVVRRFSDFKEMSSKAYNAFCALCAEAERPFYEAYRNAEFANVNYQVLCSFHITGFSSCYIQ